MKPVHPNPLEFLAAFWRLQPNQTEDGFLAFTASKDFMGGGKDGAFTEQAVNPLRRLPLLDPDDLYFAPHLFIGRKRQTQYAAPTGRWLYADLDEVDPRKDLPEDCPSPTIFWQTSPGNWQAAWLLDRPVRSATLEAMNRRLTYYTGADKGGWSLTKVLRVPGSLSYKHFDELGKPWRIPTALPVASPYCSDRPHNAASFARLLDGADTHPSHASSPNSATGLPALHLKPGMDAKSLLRKRYTPLDNPRTRRPVPPSTRQLADPNRTVLSSDDRSSNLYRLEGLLLEAGLSPEQTFVVARASAWNKYRGQRREQRQIWSEVVRHAREKGIRLASDPPGDTSDAEAAHEPKRPRPRRTTPPVSSKRSQASPAVPDGQSDGDSDPDEEDSTQSTALSEPVVWTTFQDLVTTAVPRAKWLVDAIWSDKAHGLLAGDPKTFKSLFTLDLAVSIASGTPFLGHFEIPRKGPVLIVQEENTPADMQDRLHRIAHGRGLGPVITPADDPGQVQLATAANLPIAMLNNRGFSLGDPEWMKVLRRKIRRMRPQLVILDPLYMITPGLDESSAVEMTPILAELLRLKQKYGCGILIVHHFHKPKQGAGNQRTATRMSGTGVFHRWLASALYVELLEKEGPTTVKISSEHRSHGSGGAHRIVFDLGEDDDHDLTYHVDVSPYTEKLDLTETDDSHSDVVDKVLKHTEEQTAKSKDTPPASVRKQGKRPSQTDDEWNERLEELDLLLTQDRAEPHVWVEDLAREWGYERSATLGRELKREGYNLPVAKRKLLDGREVDRRYVEAR